MAGIGASAGDLEACELLLAHLPANPGMAFVLVQHLDPKYHSSPSEILAGTGPIPVRQAADGMPIEPDYLYVTPPDAELEIANQALRLTPRERSTTDPHMPIDRFLMSLARECGSRAIGVILSGTGADGATGLEAVKASGGVTLAQDPVTAKFGSMPQAAIRRGCVDLVLPPEAIAGELAKLGHHPYLAEDQGSLSLGRSEQSQFADILAFLLDATGIDFALYRESCVRRRILRRLALRNLDNLAEYRSRLEDDPRELSALHMDLLSVITGSFRDPESFESLKRLVFPRIVEGRLPDSPIRAWVPGCGAGEEAFSIAISLSEYLDETGLSLPVRIFSSDTSGRVIERARRGRYPDSIAADVSTERLNRYFTRIDGGYQIDKAVRDMCVFSRHNVFTDPPFSKLDLVNCRNVPVYAACEQDLLPMFHYVLKPDGFLMAGGSETAAFRELFSLVDREHRIYARRETARKPFSFRTESGAAFHGNPAANNETGPPRTLGHGVSLRQEVDRLLLSRFSPAGVVVDDDLEVLEIRGKADTFLSLPADEVSFNLLKLIPETSLFLEVESLIHQVRSTGKSARRERIPFDGGACSSEVAVEVIPLCARPRNTLLILFEAAEAAAASSPSAEPIDFKDREIARLKHELAQARERFSAAIDEQQLSREESQNRVAEAISANEELQSLNEELETAKEALQSTNEQLMALNQELQSNNAALTEARDFAMSVIETVASPLLILDPDLRITAANPSFYDAFRTSRGEVEGQLLRSVSGGCWDIPGLRVMLERVLPDRKSVRDFEIERHFPAIGHRVLVVSARQLDGLQLILLGIEDVTERQERAEAILHESEQRFGSMADAAPAMIWVSGPDMACTFFNKGWLAFTGRTMQQEVGDGWTASVHPLDLDRCLAIYSSSFQARRNFQMEYRLRRADGEYRWLLDYGVPRFEAGGTFAGSVGSCTDITDLKNTQQEDLAKQKLESVGTLANGIAHDFNNLLGGVLAHTELALMELADGASPEPELDRIRAVAIRGSEIVRQLMIFAGQETEAPDLVDVSRIVEDMIELLRVAVSKHAAIETSLGRDLPALRANPAQLRQVVMNLITNASEAIGDRDGVIRIATEHVTVTRELPDTASERLPEGDYLQLVVSDTGRGMTAETKARVFDPFFTTRQAGHGLGLSVVQGVVRSLDGIIQIASAPDQGTTFRIFLPCAGHPAPATGSASVRPEKKDARVTRKATILIVEDESSMRLPLSITLRKAGLTVLEASDGCEALDFIRTHEGSIDVLLLDISLPGIPSRQVFEETRRHRPDAAVIVTSAYGKEKAAASLAAAVDHFIRKPYRLGDLLNLIREVLSS
jgi:two-component system CheB/CheR fusion protein